MDVEGLDEFPNIAGRFEGAPHVDAEDDKIAVFVFVVQRCQVRSLRTTAPSPGAPEGEKYDLPAVIGEGHPASAEAAEGKPGRLCIDHQVVRCEGLIATGRNRQTRQTQCHTDDNILNVLAH